MKKKNIFGIFTWNPIRWNEEKKNNSLELKLISREQDESRCRFRKIRTSPLISHRFWWRPVHSHLTEGHRLSAISTVESNVNASSVCVLILWLTSAWFNSFPFHWARVQRKREKKFQCRPQVLKVWLSNAQPLIVAHTLQIAHIVCCAKNAQHSHLHIYVFRMWQIYRGVEYSCVMCMQSKIYRFVMW